MSHYQERMQYIETQNNNNNNKIGLNYIPINGGP